MFKNVEYWEWNLQLYFLKLTNLSIGKKPNHWMSVVDLAQEEKEEPALKEAESSGRSLKLVESIQIC